MSNVEKKGRKPKIRFKEFTDDWKLCKLGELGKIQTGNTPSTNIKEYYSDNGIQWVTPTDITTNIINKTERKLSDLGVEVGRIVPANTILVTCIASIGKNAIVMEKSAFNQQINSLTPYFEKHNPYFLLTDSINWSNTMKKEAGGLTFQIVNKTEFSQIETNIPKEIQEEKKIGTLFQELDNLIILYQSKCDKLIDIKRALLEKMFPKVNEEVPKIRFRGFTNTWKQCKLEETSRIYDGTHQTPDYKDEGIMFLSVENIKTLQSEKYISNEDFVKNFKVYPEKNDILITRIGDIGTPNIMKEDTPKAYYVSLALIKPNNIKSEFLNVAIQSEFVQNGLKQRSLLTAIPMKINKDQIGQVDLLYPTNMSEQGKIGILFDKLDNLITLHQRKVEKLKDIKKSLLEKMFV